MGADVRRRGGAMDVLVADQPHCLLRRHFQGVRHGAVGPDNPVISIKNRDQVRDGVKGAAPLPTGLNNFFFGGNPGRDVLDHHH